MRETLTLNMLETFFKDVGKTKLLSHAEEIELSQKIEKGDAQARNHMIKANIRLAISIAKKYQRKGCTLEDLIQESNIGLMKAVDRYDWRRGFKFSTYACWWIKQAVRRHVTSQSSTVKLPSYARGLMWKIKVMREEYHDKFGTQPSQEELADLLGVSIKTLRNVIQCSAATVSLDSAVRYHDSGGAGRTLAEIIPDAEATKPDEMLDRDTIISVIRQALGSLTEREEKVIRLRFGISEDPCNDAGFPITKSEIRSLNTRAQESK